MSRTVLVGYTACGLFCLACLIGTALVLCMVAALKGDGQQVDPTDEPDDLPPDSAELSGGALALHVAAFPHGQAPGACSPTCPCQPIAVRKPDVIVHDWQPGEAADCADDCPCVERLTDDQAARIWAPVQAGIDADRAAQAAVADVEQVWTGDEPVERRQWAGIGECAHMVDAVRCHYCPPHLCHGVPEQRKPVNGS